MRKCSILLKEEFIEVRFGLELWHYHFTKNYQIVLSVHNSIKKIDPTTPLLDNAPQTVTPGWLSWVSRVKLGFSSAQYTQLFLFT